jgi:hypothetical protein
LARLTALVAIAPRGAQKQRKLVCAAEKTLSAIDNNTLDQLIRYEIQSRRNNEFCLGYQPNLHSPQGAKNNGIGARADAVEPLPNRPNTSRICSRSASTLPTEAA